MQDAAQLLPLILWLTLVLLFLVCGIGLMFSSRVLHVQARVAWWNRKGTAATSLYPQWLLACAAGIAAVLVFVVTAGEGLGVRLALMGISATATWVLFDWIGRQFVDWAERRDESARRWRAAAQESTERLRQVSDPRRIRIETTRILRESLGASAVSLYMRGLDDFVPVLHDPSPPVTPVVFSAQSLLVRELGRFPGPRSILTARGGRPLTWSRGADMQLSVEQEQLRAMDAHLVVPLAIDRAVTGFLLFGSRGNGEAYGDAEIRYVETVMRQSTDRLFFAERSIQDVEGRTQAIRHEAAQEFALAARRFLMPPEKVDLGPVEMAVGWWGSEHHRPLFYDIIGLPRRASGILLAEIDAPEAEAIVRLVQLQALVRSRFRAYDEDLPALIASVGRALKGPEDTPPVRLFVARYTPDTPGLTFVNAGFFPPMLLRRNQAGADLLRLYGETSPLNSLNEGGCFERRVALAAGDLVVIANKAVTLASGPDGESWGEGRLVDTLLGWEEQPIGDLVSLARRTIEEHEGPLAADAPSRLLMVLRVRDSAAPLLQ